MTSFPGIARRTLLAASGLAALLATGRAESAQMLGTPRALQGPMAGAPGPDRLSIWVRASAACVVTLEVAPDPEFDSIVSTASAQAGPERFCCVTLVAEGLRPETHYWYRLRYAGKPDPHQPLPFRTRTAPAGPADFSVAFGSCCRIQFDDDQRIWTAVQALDPDLFFWLGDNIYADSDEAATIADLYGRGRLVERLAPLLRSVPQLATWDDHDFGYNDSDRLSPYRERSLDLFRAFWANPGYGQPEDPGVYFKQSYGGVDFFVLDGRYHRDPADQADTASKTMLGAAQKAWLKQELKASRAVFKVLAIGGGWSSAENIEGGDSWGAYLTERNELFDFIRDQTITGVVCISGDSHMGELNCIPRSARGGYDIYDFCSSPLAQLPAVRNLVQAPEVRIRDAWTRSANVGRIRFQMSAPTPRLTFTLHDTLGRPVWEPLSLTPLDLVNGARTWEAKADPQELRRRRRFEAGGGYYGFDPPPGWPG